MDSNVVVTYTTEEYFTLEALHFRTDIRSSYAVHALKQVAIYKESPLIFQADKETYIKAKESTLTMDGSRISIINRNYLDRLVTAPLYDIEDNLFNHDVLLFLIETLSLHTDDFGEGPPINTRIHDKLHHLNKYAEKVGNYCSENNQNTASVENVDMSDASQPSKDTLDPVTTLPKHSPDCDTEANETSIESTIMSRLGAKGGKSKSKNQEHKISEVFAILSLLYPEKNPGPIDSKLVSEIKNEISENHEAMNIINPYAGRKLSRSQYEDISKRITQCMNNCSYGNEEKYSKSSGKTFEEKYKLL